MSAERPLLFINLRNLVEQRIVVYSAFHLQAVPWFPFRIRATSPESFMTISNPELPARPVAPAPDGWLPEDEIDLREYVLVLVAWWREIAPIAIGAAVVAAVAILLLRLVTPPSYESSATVAIARTQSSITFDERFTTLSQDQLQALSSVDAAARRGALVGLVSSGAVAQAVIDQLGSQLDEEERQPAYWLAEGQVETSLVGGTGSQNNSDLIRITISADSPVKAAALANAWAEHYVEQVNRIYGQIPSELVASVANELVKAQSEYESAQKELEAFVAQNEVEKLNRLITEKQDIIASLQAGKQTAITTIVDEELQARRQIISAYINAQASNRLLAFNEEQGAKRAMISALIEAESSSRLKAFSKDQETRQQLFDQYTDAQLSNHLLAFSQDQEIRRKVFNAYVGNLVNARLQAIEKAQEMRARVFAQYVNTEIENRLLALTVEQSATNQLFQVYSDADIRAKVTVFNEQVEERLRTLGRYYETRRKLASLLKETEGLRMQTSLAGDAGAGSNGLALLLLKAEVFASSADLPGQLQLLIDNTEIVGTDAETQGVDLDALISVIETRITELDRLITVQSRAVVNNEGYDLLSSDRPVDDPLYAALQQQYQELFAVGALAQAADEIDNSALSQRLLAKYQELFSLDALDATSDSVWQDSDLLKAVMSKYSELFEVGSLPGVLAAKANSTGLSVAIQSRYDELFGLGPLAQASTVFSTTTPLFASIQAQYPALFDVGALTSLTEQVTTDTPLAILGAERSKELLQLQGLEDLPAYTAAAEPLTQAIDQLASDIQALQSRQEAESSRRQQLAQRRDLAWSTLTTLKNKDAELNLSAVTVNSEVRLAAPAVEPIRPVAGLRLITTTALAGIVGLMLAVFVVFFVNFMGGQPWLQSREARG